MAVPPVPLSGTDFTAPPNGTNSAGIEPNTISGSVLTPFGGAVKSVPLSGTGGTANLIIYDNGDLKIKYPDPADSNKMGGGYYLDVEVGFQEGDIT